MWIAVALFVACVVIVQDTTLTTKVQEMATVGSIPVYSPADNWPQYVEQLKFHLQANGVESEKKRATFLTVIGSATFKMLGSDAVEAHSCVDNSEIH